MEKNIKSDTNKSIARQKGVERRQGHFVSVQWESIGALNVIGNTFRIQIGTLEGTNLVSHGKI